jgi:hypothetical protein
MMNILDSLFRKNIVLKLMKNYMCISIENDKVSFEIVKVKESCHLDREENNNRN